MGYLKDRTGFSILGDRTPPGTCPECGTVHDPSYPHNRDSLCYQYFFYDKHGRWPSWKDAMKHCSQEMKDMWIEALIGAGVDPYKVPGTDVLEISIEK